jgi:metal-responsive CopG/Arc/MetJ family transcriptional regulator
MTETISLSVTTEMRQQIDTLRGDISRSKFIRRALERALVIKEKNEIYSAHY